MEKIEEKYEQRILFDDYDEEQLQDIEGLCLVAIKEDEQTNWEIANA